MGYMTPPNRVSCWNYRVHSVDRVVDGDTIDLDVDLGFNIHQKMRIRLMDIDTPEIRGEEKVKGLKVKDLVEELCKDAESIVLESIKGKKGKYGRYLGIIHLKLAGGGWIDLNNYLKLEGYGRVQ